MAKRFPIHPAHPERSCWGCDRYCAADSLICGNGSVRTPHPVELFGDDWADWNGAPPVDRVDPDDRRAAHVSSGRWTPTSA